MWGGGMGVLYLPEAQRPFRRENERMWGQQLFAGGGGADDQTLECHDQCFQNKGEGQSFLMLGSCLR